MKRKLIVIAFALAAFLSTTNGMATLLKLAANLQTAPTAVAGSSLSADDQKTSDLDDGGMAHTDGKTWGG